MGSYLVSYEALWQASVNIILFDEKTTTLPLKDERAVHILKVLRLKEGDSFRAGVVNGPALSCRIDRIDGNGISFSCIEGEDLSPLFPLTLLLAEVRPICMKRILRETVSIGVGRILLTVSDTGEKSYHEASLYTSGEYRDILKDGAMQAGFTGIPEVSFHSSVEDALKSVREERCILLDNVVGSVRLSSLDLSEASSVLLAIGPERGWSERERRLFLSSGFTPALVGSRILRTETCAVASPVLALSRMGLV